MHTASSPKQDCTQGWITPSLPEQPMKGAGKRCSSTQHSHLGRRRRTGWGALVPWPSTRLSQQSRINRSDQQSHCGLQKTKQRQLLFLPCRGAVANLVTRSSEAPGKSHGADKALGSCTKQLQGDHRVVLGVQPLLRARQGCPQLGMSCLPSQGPP